MLISCWRQQRKDYIILELIAGNQSVGDLSKKRGLYMNTIVTCRNPHCDWVGQEESVHWLFYREEVPVEWMPICPLCHKPFHNWKGEIEYHDESTKTKT
jgi:hypothetical protein